MNIWVCEVCRKVYTTEERTTAFSDPVVIYPTKEEWGFVWVDGEELLACPKHSESFNREGWDGGWGYMTDHSQDKSDDPIALFDPEFLVRLRPETPDGKQLPEIVLAFDFGDGFDARGLVALQDDLPTGTVIEFHAYRQER